MNVFQIIEAEVEIKLEVEAEEKVEVEVMIKVEAEEEDKARVAEGKEKSITIQLDTTVPIMDSRRLSKDRRQIPTLLPLSLPETKSKTQSEEETKVMLEVVPKPMSEAGTIAIPKAGTKTKSKSEVETDAGETTNAETETVVRLAKFTTTRFGNPALLLDGHRFSKDRVQISTPDKNTSWRCIKRSLGCKATVISCDRKIIKITPHNNH